MQTYDARVNPPAAIGRVIVRNINSGAGDELDVLLDTGADIRAWNKINYALERRIFYRIRGAFEGAYPTGLRPRKQRRRR